MPKIPFALSHELRGPNLQVARVTPMSLRTGGLKGDAIQQAAETALAVIEKKVQIMEAEAAARAMTETQSALMEARIEFEKDPSKIAEYRARIQEIGENSTNGLPRRVAAAVQGSVAPMIIRAMSQGNSLHTDYMVKNSKIEFKKNQFTSGETVATDYTDINLYNQEMARLTGILVARNQAYGEGHYSKAQLEVDIIATQNYLNMQRASAHALQDPLDFLEKSAGPEGAKWMKQNYPSVDSTQTSTLRSRASGEAGRLEKKINKGDPIAVAARDALDVSSIGTIAIDTPNIEDLQPKLDQSFADNDITQTMYDSISGYIKKQEAAPEVITEDNTRDITLLAEETQDMLEAKVSLVTAQKVVYARMIEQNIHWSLVQPLLVKLDKQNKGNKEYHYEVELKKELKVGIINGLSEDAYANKQLVDGVTDIGVRMFYENIAAGMTEVDAKNKAFTDASTLSNTQHLFTKVKDGRLHNNDQLNQLFIDEQYEDAEAFLRMQIELPPGHKDKIFNQYEIDTGLARLNKAPAPKKEKLEPLPTPPELEQLEADFERVKAIKEGFIGDPYRFAQGLYSLFGGGSERVYNFKQLPEEEQQAILDKMGLSPEGRQFIEDLVGIEDAIESELEAPQVEIPQEPEPELTPEPPKKVAKKSKKKLARGSGKIKLQ